MLHTGNSTDFGDLTAASGRIGGTSNNVSGFFAGGSVPGLSNVIQKVTIASAGNAADYGDLFSARSDAGVNSNGHGGLS